MLRAECPSCGTKLKGPDEAAGRRAKCPKCGNPVTFPQKPPEAESDAWDRPPAGAFDLDDVAPTPLPPRAPAGGQEREENPYSAPKAKAPKKKKKKQSSSDDDLSTLDAVLCLLCPGIACLASIVYMIQGKGKGIKCFGLALAGWLINYVIITILQMMVGVQPGQ